MSPSFKLPFLFSLVYFVCCGYCYRPRFAVKNSHVLRDGATSATPTSVAEPADFSGIPPALEKVMKLLDSDIIGALEELQEVLDQQTALLGHLLSAWESEIPLSLSTTVPSLASLLSDSIPSESPATRTAAEESFLHITQAASVRPIPFMNATGYNVAPGNSSVTSASIPMLSGPDVKSPPTPSVSSSRYNGPIHSFHTPTVSQTYSAPSPSDTGYVFKANRDSNVAVYYGQTPTTETGGLLELCQNDNVDIVVLAFVTSLFSPSGMPSASFGPSCKGSTTSQQLHAPGLQDCSNLAPEIVSCQTLGKPVLVSLGGYYANVTFTSDADAEAIQLAQTLWDLFGAGTGLDPTLRPFGTSIIVDGFDLDNESHDPTGYAQFAAALRTLFASDTSKQYYLSAAPQCPRPDASIPLAAMAHCDFVFVQFYNNPSCDLSGSGFQDSFAAWSKDLADVSNGTKLYIGAPAFEGAGSGYVDGKGLGDVVSLARELYVENFGGVMLWDGTEGLANVDQYGDDYLLYAKASLE